MKKILFIFMWFFSSFQVFLSANFNFIDDFVERIPKDSIICLQNSLHERVRELNYDTKNKEASQKMLHSLHECLTYEIKHLKSQIKNKYSFDQRAVKQMVPFLIVAAGSTYYTYCFYKNSKQADLVITNIENKWTQANIGWSARDTGWNSPWNKLHRDKRLCEDRALILSWFTIFSYILLSIYAHNAYTLNPDRNNEFISKYQQLLRLVKLIQENQA